MTINTKMEQNRSPVLIFLQVVFLPILSLVPVAAILIWILGLNPSEQLTRGILYGCLFLACTIVGSWKFSLAGSGLSSKNVGLGFLYASIILVTGFAFMLLLQPPEGLIQISYTIWAPILFYLAVALAEETWFRGLIFKALHDLKGAPLAVFGSALLFGLMHVPMHGWEGLRFSLSIGLPYAIVRLRTGNIWGLIAIHWVTNLTDSFIRLSTASLDIVWLALLHILVFSSMSILILFLDRRLRHKEYNSNE